MSFNFTRTITFILFLAGLALLLKLGWWQFERGQEKERIQKLISAQGSSAVAVLQKAPSSWEKLQYAPAKLHGHWLGRRVFLLANRFYRHKPGYDVYGVFQLSQDGRAIAINRGWTPLDSLPITKLPNPDETTLTGKIHLPSVGFTLGPATTDGNAKQVELQYLDLKAIGDIIKHPLAPAILVLDANSPDSFQYNWEPVVMSPQRHYAYSLQWFALAATWIVFGIIWLTRTFHKDTQ